MATMPNDGRKDPAPTDATWKAYKRVLRILEPLDQRTRGRILRATVALFGLDERGPDAAV